MRFLRALLVALLLVALLTFAGTVSPAAAGVNVTVAIPPPPVVVFPAPPNIVVVPRTQVYYAPDVPDYDMYRYGGFWYINQNGYWYRSHKYNGPFTPVEYRRLPRQIVVVPREYRHHPHQPHFKHKDKD